VIDIDLASPVLRPGSAVEGRYTVDADTVRTELSLIWHTEGKGTEHREVISLVEHGASQLQLTAGRLAGRFAMTLPAAPTSYEGQLIKIRWLVRVRRWTAGGQSEMADASLVVGGVAPPEEWREA
jgi:hypothetical protein